MEFRQIIKMMGFQFEKTKMRKFAFQKLLKILLISILTFNCEINAIENYEIRNSDSKKNLKSSIS
jgi:hypothetical protein